MPTTYHPPSERLAMDTTTSPHLRRLCENYTAELMKEIRVCQRIQKKFPAFLAAVDAALTGLTLALPLYITHSISDEFCCTAEVAFGKTSSFSDLLPYLEKLEQLGDLESRDSSFAPMRIYTLKQVHDSRDDVYAPTITLFFKLYVRLPNGGTDTCEVQVVQPPETIHTPMPQYALVCKG